MMKRIVVTGGSGMLGRYVVQELAEHGYSVVSSDQRAYDGPQIDGVHYTIVDLTDAGDVYDLLRGADGVVHLAAYPGGAGRSQKYIFTNNTVSTYQVLEACSTLGIGKVVIGSSESAYGFYWGEHLAKPQYFPIDEEHPMLPSESYGLTKIVNEQTAAMFHRNSGMQVVSCRFSLIVRPDRYEGLIQSFEQPERLIKNLWAYIDVRDAASACHSALLRNGLGNVALNVTGDSPLSSKPAEELIETFFPNVPKREGWGERGSLVSNAKAKRLLQWSPRYTWQDA